jgi:hypothetical protein
MNIYDDKPVRLMNSAMMPCSGIYECMEISEEIFAHLLKVANDDCGIDSYIGYKENIAHIKALTGIEVPLNRSLTPLMDGDHILAMRKRYNPDEARAKNERTGEGQWQYFTVIYQAPKPVTIAWAA